MSIYERVFCVLETKLGKINYTATGAGHAYFCTDPVNVEGEKLELHGKRLELRGVPYCVTLHLYKMGLEEARVTFGVLGYDWACKSVLDLHVVRCDRYGVNITKDVSHAARKAIFGAIQDAWSRIDKVEMLLQAECNDLDQKIKDQTEKVTKLRSEAESAELLLHVLADRRASLTLESKEGR